MGSPLAAPTLEEMDALALGAGLTPRLGRDSLDLTGADRVRWMNGMVTNNIRDLAPGAGVYSFLLTAQGRILGDFYVYNRGEYLLMGTERAQARVVTVGRQSSSGRIGSRFCHWRNVRCRRAAALNAGQRPA